MTSSQRTALVTGSSAGIGRAIAERLAGDGLRVAVNSRIQERADAVAAEIRAKGGDAVGLAADVADPEQARGLVEQAVVTLGQLDVLVNNAGIPMTSPSEDLSVADWQRALATNLTAPFVCSQAAGRHMLTRGSGVIVMISSIFGHVGMPQRAAYASAKHGLLGLTKVLAIEWAERGVRVASVDPGYVATDLVTVAAGAEALAGIAARTPQKRIATPAEIAHAVAFVASEDASYLTGSSVVVDGGWLASGAW